MMQRACAVRMMKKPMLIRIKQIKIFYHIFAPCTSIAKTKSIPMGNTDIFFLLCIDDSIEILYKFMIPARLITHSGMIIHRQQHC